jgi:hypothetical protein
MIALLEDRQLWPSSFFGQYGDEQVTGVGRYLDVALEAASRPPVSLRSRTASMRSRSPRSGTSVGIPISSAKARATRKPKRDSKPRSSAASRPEPRKWTLVEC